MKGSYPTKSGRTNATDRTTHVGDWSDTSPYTADKPVNGISTAAYIANMASLIRSLNGGR
jgi:hypothetical protein